jgi:hypothetical protein
MDNISEEAGRDQLQLSADVIIKSCNLVQIEVPRHDDRPRDHTQTTSP